MPSHWNLTDEQMLALSNAMASGGRPQQLHDAVRNVRAYVDGKDTVEIPQSHRALKVGTNHEGGLRLNRRITQGAAWLSGAALRFQVTPGSTEFRTQAEQMARFAKAAEARLSRGTPLHNWRMEANRDLFECGVSFVQHHPKREYYLAIRNDPLRFARGARVEDIFHRRRVDPLYVEWDEDADGEIGAFQINGPRMRTQLSHVTDHSAVRSLYEADKRAFAWAASFMDDFDTGGDIDVRELWTPDRGVIICTQESRSVKPDDPRRIIARWDNVLGKPPFYPTAASPWPWTSPLDEMIQLTAERNLIATILDHQQHGAAFRHWQLVDEGTGDALAAALWDNPVAENVLLDLSKPPPQMGPGKKWELAPFEFIDILPRYQLVVAQHESAGASVARLMGEVVNANTAVGTADMMEDFARREFSSVLDSYGATHDRIWEDSFAHIAEYHRREPVIVAGRKRDMTQVQFFQTHLELRGSDVVAEDVTVTPDTRSRIALMADYRMGREMQTNGDIGYDRRVEQGLVPFVDDAQEEKAAIVVDTAENIALEQQISAMAQEEMQNLGVGAQEPMAAPAPPNITRGARTDPRGTGTGRGPDNMSDTALAAGATDTLRAV